VYGFYRQSYDDSDDDDDDDDDDDEDNDEDDEKHVCLCQDSNSSLPSYTLAMLLSFLFFSDLMKLKDSGILSCCSGANSKLCCCGGTTFYTRSPPWYSSLHGSAQK
jgi:hypothetical protein